LWCLLCPLPRRRHLIIRAPLPPAGGLKNELRSGEAKGGVVMAGPNTYGVPPGRRAGSILRRQVAEVCAAALVEPAAADQVVEVVAEPGAPLMSMAELFGKAR
jgi:uncharacterized protein YbjT (DUF2867 family)